MPADRRSARPTESRTPGDVARGTQEEGATTTAASRPGGSRDFAERQSFADPAHRPGGIRAPATGRQGSAPPGAGPDAGLLNASEEE